ncbi:matrixin family metalloprotease [Polynucleobacter paneuropaeus]|nr:matrixin family metalloprotease [Polynucleobacter paneuropaeus]
MKNRLLHHKILHLFAIAVFCAITSVSFELGAEEIDKGEISAEPSNSVLFRWPNHSPFRWHYSNLNKPSWLSDGQAKTLFTNAAKAWSECGVMINYGGEMNEEPGNPDANNILGWSNLPPRIRGFTYRKQRAGDLISVSIIINNENDDIKNNPVLLQKVVTHEFGHALGLVHSRGCQDVMSSAATCGSNPNFTPPTTPTENDLIQCKLRYGNKK